MARILLIACGSPQPRAAATRSARPSSCSRTACTRRRTVCCWAAITAAPCATTRRSRARYPFSQEARQARLDLIYAYYRAREQESAVDAADQFVRENPTHPRVDYAMYLRGLIYFERSPNFLERWFNTDLSERPPQDVKRAFDAFDQLIRARPDSVYAHDARQRMVFLRNRLADYEVYVADHYMRREAYVAAIDRARYCIENYDGAPAVREALEIMIASYRGMGLDDLAERSQEVFALNYPDATLEKHEKKWWRFD